MGQELQKWEDGKIKKVKIIYQKNAINNVSKYEVFSMNIN